MYNLYLKIKHISLIVFSVTIFGAQINAQEHEYSKQISKTVPANNKNLTIDAQKANIILQGTAGENYIIEIKLVSKNLDKEKAEYQLNYLKHIINIKSKEVYVRNYIVLEENDELTGSITAEYNIKVPSKKELTITNSLGDIVIKNIDGNFNISTKYGNVSLFNLTGTLNIINNIGELILENCNLSSSIESKYSNAYIHNCKGIYNLTCNLGALNISLNKNIQKLNINSTGTEINLHNKNCTEFKLDLSCNNGKLFIDKCNAPIKSFIILDTRNLKHNNAELKYINPSITSSIKIKNKFANISIQ